MVIIIGEIIISSPSYLRAKGAIITTTIIIIIIRPYPSFFRGG